MNSSAPTFAQPIPRYARDDARLLGMGAAPVFPLTLFFPRSRFSHHLTDKQLRPPSIFRYSDISSSATSWPLLRRSAAVFGKPAATSSVSLTLMQLAAYSSPLGTGMT